MQFFVPGKPLSDFVALFWYWNQTPETSKERVLPGGSIEFVIRLTKDRIHVSQSTNFKEAKSFSGAVITGPQAKFFVLDKSEQDELLGVHFKPGGAYPFFGLPADEFLNEHVSLDCVWGSSAESLRSELLEAPTIPQKFKVLEIRLLERLVKSSPRHMAVAFALNNLATLSKSVSEVAEETNLSRKRLTQLFSREVGMTPKLFSRVQRFQNSLAVLAKQQNADWMTVALECGYYDQAHFNHDFLEFSGLNPTAYLQKGSAHLGHVPL